MMNRAGLDMIEADSLDQVKGLCVYPLVTEEYREAFKDMVKGVYKGESRALEFKVIGLKGRPVWLYSHAVPLRDEKGDILSMISATIDITERKMAEDERNRSLREKEVLLREIHHRVKNNLAIISSLLMLQSRRTEDVGAKDVLRGSQDRIRSMALVHEKLYKSADLARVDFRDYARELATELLRSYGSGRIRLDAGGDEAHMEIDTLIPCGLILNELVTNSIKHAFDGIENPEIRVKVIKKKGYGIEFFICDNGRGLPPGEGVGKSNTLGFQIVSALVGQLKGTLELEPQKGTAFKISLPMPDYAPANAR